MKGEEGGEGGGRDRGLTALHFPYHVLPPPVLLQPFAFQLPPFTVLLLPSWIFSGLANLLVGRVGTPCNFLKINIISGYKTLRFLWEVEIFSKPLQKGLKVVHTLSELLIYTSSIIQWHVCGCLILTKGICRNKVFYGLIFLLPYWKILKLINLVLWHLTWLTLFPGEFQLLQLLTLCAYFMLSYSWPIMQLTSWGV